MEKNSEKMDNAMPNFLFLILLFGYIDKKKCVIKHQRGKKIAAATVHRTHFNNTRNFFKR